MLKSCCCMRLKKGGMVIGWLGVLGSTMTIVFLCTLWANVDHNSQLPDGKLITNIINASILIFMCAAILNLLASSLLLLGIFKGRHLLLLPWLINSGLNIVILAHATFRAFLETVKESNKSSNLVTTVLVLSISIYIFSAICALYSEIQRANDQKNSSLKVQSVTVAYQATTYPNV